MYAVVGLSYLGVLGIEKSKIWRKSRQGKSVEQSQDHEFGRLKEAGNTLLRTLDFDTVAGTHDKP